MTQNHTRLSVLCLTLFGLTMGCASKDETDGDAAADRCPEGTVDNGEGECIDDNAETDADADTDDTGTVPDPEDLCSGIIEKLSPEDAQTGWFYRDTLTVTFTDVPDPVESVDISLVTEDGEAVPFTVTWNDVHSLDAYLSAELVGNTVYTLTASCENEMNATFETDEFGSPMESSSSDLIGKVFELDLPNAEFTEPPAVGALLGSYLSSPLLASVQAADEENLTLLVAQGYWDEDGVAHQDMGTGCYDFPPADFSASPFFAADTDYINILYQSGSVEANIPMRNMHLEGTFSPDGGAIGGAWIGGLVDTSSLGPLLDIGDSDEPEVICEYVSVFGLSCEDCGDGSELCLYVEAHFDDAPLLEGMTIDPDPLGESDGG